MLVSEVPILKLERFTSYRGEAKLVLDDRRLLRSPQLVQQHCGQHPWRLRYYVGLLGKFHEELVYHIIQGVLLDSRPPEQILKLVPATDAVGVPPSEQSSGGSSESLWCSVSKSEALSANY